MVVNRFGAKITFGGSNLALAVLSFLSPIAAYYSFVVFFLVRALTGIFFAAGFTVIR